MSAIITPDSDQWKAAMNSEYPEPGLYAEIPASVYHGQWLHPSQSRMKPAIQKTPEHAKFAMDNPKASTPAMLKGTALHAMVLEPDKVDELVQIGPEKTRSQTWQALQDANPHIAYLKPEEYAACRVMADRVKRHPDVRAMGRKKMDSVLELSVVSDLVGNMPAALDAAMPAFSLRCKCRLDWWVQFLEWLVDLKSTSDAAEDEFNRDIHKRGYNIQGAFYEAMMAAHGVHIKRIVFVIVENEAPFVPDVRPLGLEAWDRGRVLARKMVALWAWCVAHDEYPAFPDGLATVANIPRWAMTTTDAYSAWEELLSDE